MHTFFFCQTRDLLNAVCNILSDLITEHCFCRDEQFSRAPNTAVTLIDAHNLDSREQFPAIGDTNIMQIYYESHDVCFDVKIISPYIFYDQIDYERASLQIKFDLQIPRKIDSCKFPLCVKLIFLYVLYIHRYFCCTIYMRNNMAKKNVTHLYNVSKTY